MCCDTTANATPFYRAAVAADVEAMKLMLARGANVEWSPAKPEKGGGGPMGNMNVGKTPLMVAMNGGRGVSQSGGPGNLREGPPPFREPSNRVPAEAVTLLLEAGANPDALAPDGSAAIHQATLGGKLSVIRALAAGGATLDLPNKDGHTALWLAENPPPPRPAIAGAPRDDSERVPPEEIAAALRDLMAAGPATEPKVAAATRE